MFFPENENSPISLFTRLLVLPKIDKNTPRTWGSGSNCMCTQLYFEILCIIFHILEWMPIGNGVMPLSTFTFPMLFFAERQCSAWKSGNFHDFRGKAS
jgi:hypothetical protein